VRILFLADFYDHHLNGGAESNDAVLIEHLRQSKNNITCKSTKEITTGELLGYDRIIISNFMFLSPHVKAWLTSHSSYIIYEHDHKYIKTRDPSKFTDFKIPEDQLVNIEFYRNANLVVVLSKICKEVILKSIPEASVESIGTSLWTKKKLDYIRARTVIQKTKKNAVVSSQNPTKGMMSAISFCQQKQIDFDLISSADPYEFIDILGTYHSLIYIPQVLETYCRLVVEAKMLGCQVYTNKNLIGFMSEPIAKLQGSDLIDQIEIRVDAALKKFDEILER
jgi:hypothetical protein